MKSEEVIQSKGDHTGSPLPDNRSNLAEPPPPNSVGATLRGRPHRQKRKSTRAMGYDYSEPGSYFITICTQENIPLFGNIHNGITGLNEAGCMILRWWNEIPNKFPLVAVLEEMIMPNHFHGIISISDGRPHRAAPTKLSAINSHGRTHWVTPTNHNDNVGATLCGRPSLGEIVGWFKTMTTNEYIRSVHQYQWKRFSKRLWQRNYYDRIIRNDDELYRIQQYVLDNPLQFELDKILSEDVFIKKAKPSHIQGRPHRAAPTKSLQRIAPAESAHPHNVETTLSGRSFVST
jgi:putative transposase